MNAAASKPAALTLNTRDIVRGAAHTVRGVTLTATRPFAARIVGGRGKTATVPAGTYIVTHMADADALFMRPGVDRGFNDKRDEYAIALDLLTEAVE